MTIGHEDAIPDPQAERVYDMENSVVRAWRSHATSIAKLKRMAREVCTRYDVPIVTIELMSSKNGMLGRYDYDHDVIELCEREGRQAFVLAHEIAHHVTHKLHPRAADHGPTWARHYINIVAFLGVMPKNAMLAMLREHGIRIR